MFKSIWNIIVKACKAIKNVVTRKYINNFSTDVVEGTTLVTPTTEFKWLKWFSGEYRFQKDVNLEKCKSHATKFKWLKNILVGTFTGLIIAAGITGASLSYVGANLVLAAFFYVAFSFCEAMDYRF